MRKWITASLVAAGLSLSSTALPCGGGFGSGLELDPAQNIVIGYDAGVETYTFSPHFCGEAADFGLILPVPAALSTNPAIADKNLVKELEDLTQPTVVKVTKCQDFSNGGYGGGGWDGTDGGQGTQVISKGQVGIFEWVLLKADTTQAFTDWLDANKFPHGPNATGPFDAYVQAGWYFVAFKVTADTQAPPAGFKLCGDLGPIQLAFPSAKPVVPARIAGATSGSNAAPPSWAPIKWRIYLLASGEGSLSTASSSFIVNPMFSGALSSADLAGHPAVATQAAAGDRLTAMEVAFEPAYVSSDIEVDFAATPKDFRWTKEDVTYVVCDAGAGGTGGTTGSTGGSATGGAGGNSPAPHGTIIDDGGCATGAGGASGAAAVGWLAALGAIAGRVRRRTRAAARRT